MKVIILPHDKAVAKYAYKIVMDRLSNGINTIGLPCGSKPLLLYAEIANGFKRGELDFSGVSIFSQTEFLCMEGNEQGSCRQVLEDQLFCFININPDNVHHLDGVTDDHVRECQFYEDDIEYLGGIKFQVLTLGRNGQIAFNEPGVSLSSRTGFAALSGETMEEYRPFFPSNVKCPKYALSMGIGTIMEADECLIIATGEEMADAVAATVEGPVSASCPASALQYHTNCLIVVDEAAAQKLRYASYYKATMDAEDRAVAKLMAYRNDKGIE
ncbi:MAG: glucosamine-6-phosphate deaminase [Victivallales bacterium]|nr:glucosamine-6-phosphate deaminase [Victivallales bacterium]